MPHVRICGGGGRRRPSLLRPVLPAKPKSEQWQECRRNWQQATGCTG
jgi:hypothetical protein